MRLSTARHVVSTDGPGGISGDVRAKADRQLVNWNELGRVQKRGGPKQSGR
jgi:hypothetical protein